MPTKLPMRVVHRTVSRGPITPRRRNSSPNMIDVMPYPTHDPVPTYLGAEYPNPLPSGTNLFVPGFLSDEEQFRQDQRNLGIAPLAIAAAIKPLTSLVHISFGKAVNSETFAKSLLSLALAGNLTAGVALLSRGAIKTQGFAQLYSPLIAQYQSQRPDFYAQAKQMAASAATTPGGIAFWRYAPGDVMGAVTRFAVYAKTGPYTGGPATPTPVTVAQPTQALPGGQPMVSNPYVPTDQPANGDGGSTPVVTQDGSVTTTTRKTSSPGFMSMFGGGGSSIPMLMGVGLLAFLLNKRR